MIFRVSLLLLFLGFVSAGFSQAGKPVQLGKNASDCLGALMLNDTVVGPVYSPKGWGNKLEISGYELGDPYFIEKEHNTVWYKFIVPYDAIFTFDLIPNIKTDDFDFLIFQYDGPNFCKDIERGTKIPIRTNISRKNIDVNGKTGLAEGSINEYVPSGPGSSYSKPLKVKKGEMYYLLVDNPFKENEGHTIYLHFRKLDPVKKTAPEEKREEEYSIPYRKLKITVTDKKTGDRLASNIKIDGVPDSVQSSFPSVSQVELDVISYRNYEISVVKQGYLLATQTFLAKNDSLYEVPVKLKKMELGDRLNLEKIKFEMDETDILEESLPALDQLISFMEANPNIHIEIQGHVNGESKKNKRKYIKLSEARAESIYNKLKESGISKDRMDFKGFGNAKMIYPTPINNRQAEANRRVEIEIVKL
jgi:outer membrane protein OmpA-like peptidoglycan-associated protein